MDTLIRLAPRKTYYFRGNFHDGTYLVKYARGRTILFMDATIVRFSDSWSLREFEELVNLSVYDDSRWFLVEHEKAHAILRRHGVSAKDAE